MAPMFIYEAALEIGTAVISGSGLVEVRQRVPAVQLVREEWEVKEREGLPPPPGNPRQQAHQGGGGKYISYLFQRIPTPVTC